MKKMFLLAWSLFILGSNAIFASETGTDKFYNTVQVDFVGADNAKVPMNYQMQKRKDGAWRIRIPKQDMEADTRTELCGCYKGLQQSI